MNYCCCTPQIYCRYCQKAGKPFRDVKPFFELNGKPPQRKPPQRTWIGLTNEDLSVCDEDGVVLARYWEAKLKQKNGYAEEKNT